MNLAAFLSTISSSEPPKNVSVYLLSLWYDAKGNWEESHNTIQDIEDDSAAWIHAYLHRKEGDLGNADYWYRRAGRKKPLLSLEEEWHSLAVEMAQKQINY